MYEFTVKPPSHCDGPQAILFIAATYRPSARSRNLHARSDASRTRRKSAARTAAGPVMIQGHRRNHHRGRKRVHHRWSTGPERIYLVNHHAVEDISHPRPTRPPAGRGLMAQYTASWKEYSGSDSGRADPQLHHERNTPPVPSITWCIGRSRFITWLYRIAYASRRAWAAKEYQKPNFSISQLFQNASCSGLKLKRETAGGAGAQFGRVSGRNPRSERLNPKDNGRASLSRPTGGVFHPDTPWLNFPPQRSFWTKKPSIKCLRGYPKIEVKEFLGGPPQNLSRPPHFRPSAEVPSRPHKRRRGAISRCALAAPPCAVSHRRSHVLPPLAAKPPRPPH